MSAKYECVLPFPRGSTYGDRGLVTMSSDTAQDLEGRCFEADDTINSTPKKVVLRIVRNGSGGALTCAKKFFKYGTSAGQLGRVITGLCDSAGMIGKPMDEKYVDDGITSIAANDLFYVIEAGPTKVLTEASAVSLSAHAALATDANGLINGAAAAAGEAVLATLDSAATSTNTATLIFVKADAVDSDAA